MAAYFFRKSDRSDRSDESEKSDGFEHNDGLAGKKFGQICFRHLQNAYACGILCRYYILDTTIVNENYYGKTGSRMTPGKAGSIGYAVFL